jgi:hypothetical protein
MESIPLNDNGIDLGNSAVDAVKEKVVHLKKTLSVYTHDDLKQRIKEIGSEKYLIEGLLPDRSLGVLVGDSGLGKSPLVYQMAACIAAGIPFLGRAVKQGRVLCMDFENGIGQVDEMLDNLYQHLDLSKSPENLFLWNINDADPKYGQKGYTALETILKVKPNFVTIDSLTGMFPDIEEKNSHATKCLQQFRTLIRDYGTSILALHHTKKPSEDPKYAPKPLETCPNIRIWFNQARGARAIINGSDSRIGVDIPEVNNYQIADGKDKEEIALVMRGFARVKGDIPLTYLSRHCDENGEPLGYGVVKGTNLLFNKEQEEALAKLPDKFKFKDAKQALSKADEATDKFLKKCVGLGLIRKIGKKEGYEKL